MIDLTKPFELRHVSLKNTRTGEWNDAYVVEGPQEKPLNALEYGTLFQESPRTKLDYEDLVELAKYALQDGEYQWRSELWAFVKEHEEPGSVERGADGKLLRTLDGWEERRVWVDDFERTKLEHGKMLAMLKRLINPAFTDKETEQFEVFTEMFALVAEIEGDTAEERIRTILQVHPMPDFTEAERRDFKDRYPSLAGPVEGAAG